MARRTATRVTRPDGALAELFKMKDEGLADAVGIAGGPIGMMKALLSDWDFDAVISHNRFTLVNRSALDLLQLAQSKGIAFINAAPYATGLLAKGSSDTRTRYVYRPATSRMLVAVRSIEAICAKYAIPIGAAALQFSIKESRISSTICGVTKPERVRQTLEWAQWRIPEEAWTELLVLPYDTHDPELDQR